MNKRQRKKIEKINKKKKIVMAILFSGILLSKVNASVVVPVKNIDVDLVKTKIEDAFNSVPENQIDYSMYAPTPFEIQGRFETNWDKNNYWNSNDNGGVAVGPFQIHSKYMLSPFFDFLQNNAPEYYSKLNEKGGIEAIKSNTKEMKNYFCDLCSNDEKFVKLQADFINAENFEPRLNSLKSKYNLDLSNRPAVVEGIFRAMSANIAGRTNWVVEDMIKTITKDDFKISSENITSEMMEQTISSLKINKISDVEFVDILQDSIHNIVNTKIQPEFQKQLITAYDATINKYVKPNLEKEVLTAEEKENLEYKNKLEKAEKIVASIGVEFHQSSLLNNQKIKNTFINSIVNDTSKDFEKSKSLLSDYVKNKELLLTKNIVKQSIYEIDEKKSFSVKKQNNLLYMKKEDEQGEFALIPSKSKALPPKKKEIITVENVVKMNPNFKTEFSNMDMVLSEAASVLSGIPTVKKENLPYKVKTVKSNTKKAIYAEKRANELTIDNVVAKASLRKDHGQIKPENDFSSILAQAVSYIR